MTSTVSFKDKLKQIFSVILWDLKGCKGSLMVYTILASVFTVIIFTLVFVLTADQTSFSPLFSTESSPKISLSEKMQVFQVISSAIIGFLTLIFYHFSKFYSIVIFCSEYVIYYTTILYVQKTQKKKKARQSLALFYAHKN